MSDDLRDLGERLADAIRDANGTPEALAAWQRHPQLVPAHVYADAVLPVVEAETAELRERAEGAEWRVFQVEAAWRRENARADDAEATCGRLRRRREEAEREREDHLHLLRKTEDDKHEAERQRDQALAAVEHVRDALAQWDAGRDTQGSIAQADLAGPDGVRFLADLSALLSTIQAATRTGTSPPGGAGWAEAAVEPYRRLLSTASTHLRALCHVGRHDTWGVNLGCGACQLAREIDAALEPPAKEEP